MKTLSLPHPSRSRSWELKLRKSAAQVVPLATVLLIVPAWAQTQPLNDTGQITRYNAGASATPHPEVAADAIGQMVKMGASTASGLDRMVAAKCAPENPEDVSAV